MPAYLREELDSAFALREQAATALAESAETVAQACHDMALRFHRGGKLIVFGAGGSAADAAHIAVEFLHPVIVGKRALPALALANDVATVTGVADRTSFEHAFAHQLRVLAEPADIAMAVSRDGAAPAVRAALAEARGLGLLTVALTGNDGGRLVADHLLVVESDDPETVQEIHVTMYHILWELVHVFLERPGLLAPAVLS